MTSCDAGVAWYDRNAPELADQYEGADFEAVHGWLLPLFDGAEDGPVLDIGAGFGRDARWP